MAGDDSGAAATMAFRMSSGKGGGIGTGGSTGASNESVFVGLDIAELQLEVGKSGPFSHIASNLLQALGYFESALSLKGAMGMGFAIPTPMGKIHSSLFSGGRGGGK